MFALENLIFHRPEHSELVDRVLYDFCFEIVLYVYPHMYKCTSMHLYPARKYFLLGAPQGKDSSA